MWLFLALMANALWSQHDIINSVLVRHYHRHPVYMTLVLSIFELCILLSITIFFPLRSEHALLLMLGGFLAYVGLVFYFWVIDYIDASVVSVSWAFTNIFVALGAFLFFDERLTLYGYLGVLLVLSGALLLAFWHHHGAMVRTLFSFALLGFLYTPLFLLQKSALLAGETPMTVLFWSIFGQKSLAIVMPFLLPWQRKMVGTLFRSGTPLHFYFLLFTVGVFSIVGYMSSTFAYALAPAALVSATLNTQSFMVIILAWIWSWLLPHFAPRELLTAQSVGVKVVSFVLVFLGLALLGISQ